MGYHLKKVQFREVALYGLYGFFKRHTDISALKNRRLCPIRAEVTFIVSLTVCSKAWLKAATFIFLCLVEQLQICMYL